jgi:hypothetical protein
MKIIRYALAAGALVSLAAALVVCAATFTATAAGSKSRPSVQFQATVNNVSTYG